MKARTWVLAVLVFPWASNASSEDAGVVDVSGHWITPGLRK
jgi:imidazolonepropionase-like amidohydrolase